MIGKDGIQVAASRKNDGLNEKKQNLKASSPHFCNPTFSFKSLAV